MSDVNYFNKQAILVCVLYNDKKKDIVFSVKEFKSLVFSAGIRILDILLSKDTVCNAKYFIGIGKVLELECMVKSSSASVILFDHSLSSRQERNLTNLLKRKIIDRNQLILNIFAQRARTYSGKLQVQLAHLRYLNSRLTHEWSHLERQRGGIGLRGGPGEMQLENDRRVLRKKISQTVLYLKKVNNQREQSRRKRFKMGIPVISLVGYTNSGKSTLFNVMTNSTAYVDVKLFSTLDPMFRRVISEGGFSPILIDTVGFIHNLPKDLIFAFNTTLKEITESTLLLHVVDASNERYEQNINIVNRVLHDINSTVPVLLVMNKIDQLSCVAPHIERDVGGLPIKIWISSKKLVGISLLKRVLDELLSDYIVHYDLRIPMNHNLFQKLYKLQAITECSIENDFYVKLKIHLSYINWNRLLKNDGSLLGYII